jgi:hypothetical protein
MPTLEDVPSQLLSVANPSAKESETRLKDAQSARGLIEKLILEDRERSRRRTLVKGLIDGNPPYSTEKQRAAGLAWQANLNLMEGKALMDSSGIPYYALFAGAETYAEIQSDFEPDNPDHNLWCGQAAARFHQMLKRWPQFDWHIQQISFWMRLHGTGPYIFEKDGDWRIRALESGSVLVPKNAPSCFDKRIPYVVVRWKYRSHELFGFIRDEETASAAGWDVQAVKLALRKAYISPGADAMGQVQWEDLQRRLKNDDLFTAYSQSDEIAVSHIFVTEYSGKVSHFIVAEMVLTEDDKLKDPNADRRFLYKHVARYNDFKEVGGCFFQDIGDGTWHSVRGLADLAFKHLEVLNRLDCRMIDGAFIDGGIVLQPEGTKDIDKIQSLQWGPFTILPAGLKMQNGRMSGQIEGTMAVSRVVRNGLGNNIGMFNQRSVAREDGRGEAVTAEQIRAQVSKESSLNQGQMALAYLAMDGLYDQMFRRAKADDTTDEEALRFLSECEQDGIPKDFLDKARARANRAAGYGSPQMAFMQLNQMMPLLGSLPEDGKNNFIDMFIQATLGAEKVRTLNPKRHIPSDDDAIAALENMMFDSGRAPVLAAGQNDVIHMQSHIADSQEKLGPLEQAIEQGEQADPAAMQQAQVYVSVFLPHAEAHLERMRTDPARRQLVTQFEQQMKQVVSFDGKLRAELIKAQREAAIAAEEAQNASALDATTAASIRKTEADIANDRAKTIAKIEDSRAKVLNQNRLKTIQTAEQIRMARVAQKEKPQSDNGSK